MTRNFSWFSVLIIALAASLGALYIDHQFFTKGSSYQSLQEAQQDWTKRFGQDSLPAFSANINFVAASKKVRHSVVYVKTIGNQSGESLKKFHRNIPDFEDQFDFPGPIKEGSGSGVILSEDGLIVTNHHVIENAQEINVILNSKQQFKARIIGQDPSTDLALLKIEARGLPILALGNSDKVEIGEWVLAIGNPFDLSSTVTAGIISGKGRSINILREKSRLAIESFIQTDAAVNPGNSGGALVDLKGELIGINTAIASPTGSYSGYSFAIPVNLVSKVVNDLLKYGQVQRGLLGISIDDITDQLAKSKSLDDLNGVYVRDVAEGSAGKKAGISQGDIIISINGKKVNSVPELQETVGQFRPGDKIKVELKRDTRKIETIATLANEFGESKASKSAVIGSGTISEWGLELAPASMSQCQELGITSGLEITRIIDPSKNKLGLEKGWIVSRIDKKVVSKPSDCQNLLKNLQGGILIECYTPAGEKKYLVYVK